MPSPEEPVAPPGPSAAPGATTVVAPPGSPGNTVDPLIGTVLAERYQIVRRIGEGGMGAVYEGKHTVLGRQVAVKVLLEKFLEKTELVARLLQEARLASAIGHENIVDVTDFGTTADGRSYVVMEFLEGESLAQVVIRDAPLAVDRCLRIARQVVSALVAAHDKGIVHRDIKPENVFLLRRGEQDFVKVVDFGVSKAVRSRDDGAEMLRLTRTGMVLGTPLYMSPEQARGGDDVDVRADVWAVGVMLYECLTGEVPFRANNYLGVISQVLTQEVQPPSKLRPELGIPPAVEAVVMRAMEKDRERRYQQMSELERDLDRLLAGDPNVGISETAPTLSPEPRRTSARWHLGIFAVLVVGIGLAFSLARTEEERRSAPARAARAAAEAKVAQEKAAVKAPAPRPPPPAPAPAAPVTEGTVAPSDGLLAPPAKPERPASRSRPKTTSQATKKKQQKTVDDRITDPEEAFRK
jgi:tRNA A-37 threonylcarbamoyl transferase component Bud32